MNCTADVEPARDHEVGQVELDAARIKVLEDSSHKEYDSPAFLDWSKDRTNKTSKNEATFTETVTVASYPRKKPLTLPGEQPNRKFDRLVNEGADIAALDVVNAVMGVGGYEKVCPSPTSIVH